MIGNYVKKVILNEKNGKIVKGRPFKKKRKKKEKLFHYVRIAF
jgi:hypothetical protein